MANTIESRKNKRYPSIAKVKIPKVFTGDALLKDISVTGCRIECTMRTDVHEESTYAITIFPEDTAAIDSFNLLVDCKWVHSSGYSCDIGFDIKKSPGKRDFARYVDYLSWRQKT